MSQITEEVVDQGRGIRRVIGGRLRGLRQARRHRRAPAPPASTAPSAAPSASAAAFDGMVYPETGEAPCGVAPYTGQLKKITAVDRLTVEFQLCGPAADFLPKIAFSAFGIQDSDYLEAHAADGSLLDKPNGTGPYTAQGMEPAATGWSGQRVRRLLGHQGPDPEPRVPLERPGRAAARRAAGRHASTASTTRAPPTSPRSRPTRNLQYKARAGLNTLVPRLQQHDRAVGRRQGPPGHRHGHRPRAIVENFYPEGSTAADYFTPCEIPFACEGDKNWAFDPAAAKALLTEAGFPNGFETKIQFRAAVRGYVTDPPQIATEIAQQLKANLNITAAPELLESAAMLDGFAAGTLDGHR